MLYSRTDRELVVIIALKNSPKYMIPVQMGDEDAINLAHRKHGPDDLPLRSLPTIEKPLDIASPECHRRTTASYTGHLCHRRPTTREK